MSALDLEEFAQALRVGADNRLADLGAEILELLDGAWMADAYLQALEGLERITEQKFPDRAEDEVAALHLDWIEARLAKLEEADEGREEAMADALETLTDAAGLIEEAGKAFTAMLKPATWEGESLETLEYDL
jgi:hypothetical protein